MPEVPVLCMTMVSGGSLPMMRFKPVGDLESRDILVETAFAIFELESSHANRVDVLVNHFWSTG